MKIMSGRCFICAKECDEEAYCHYDCALAYSEHKTKLLSEARSKLKGGKQ